MIDKTYDFWPIVNQRQAENSSGCDLILVRELLLVIPLTQTYYTEIVDPNQCKLV